MKKLSLMFVCFMLISVPVYAQILNGSFEATDGTCTPSPGYQQVNAPNTTAIPGWSITAGSIDLICGYWTASDGAISLDMIGDSAGGPGTISQNFATIIGKLYTILFDLSGNPSCGQQTVTLSTSATGSSIQNYNVDTGLVGSLPTITWTPQSYAFVATNNTTTLTFAATSTSNNCGPALDNVRLLAQGDPNTITIIKDAVPDSPDSFAFTSTDFGNFSLVDDGTTPELRSQTFLVDRANNPFSFTEAVPAGWTLTSINCVTESTGVTWNATLGTATLDIDLSGPGQEITCTFTNQLQPVATPVPTYNEWGMIIFIAIAGLGSVYYLRRQRRANN